MHDFGYNSTMCETIDREIVAAYLRGERELIELLEDAISVRNLDNTPVSVDNLNENQRRGYDNLVRRLRDAA